MSSEAKNLEAISRAIDQHNKNCEFDLVEVRMNPFEVERLGWDNIRGIPITADPEIGTGRFRLVCANDMNENADAESEDVYTEAVSVSKEKEIVTV